VTANIRYSAFAAVWQERTADAAVDLGTMAWITEGLPTKW